MESVELDTCRPSSLATAAGARPGTALIDTRDAVTGRPLSHVTVVATSSALGDAVDGETDEGGHLRLHLPAGVYTLTYSRRLSRVSLGITDCVHIEPGRSSQVTARLVPDAADATASGPTAGELSGTVTLESGTAIPRAGVYARPCSTCAAFSTETDQDGRFRLRVPAGAYEVTVEEFSAWIVRVHVTAPPGVPTSLDLVLDENAVELVRAFRRRVRTCDCHMESPLGEERPDPIPLRPRR